MPTISIEELAKGSNVKAVIVGDHLIVALPLQQPAPSTSGKTLVVATTRGNLKTSTQVHGRELTIGVNAYIAK